jgi:hypothetical protein
MWRKPKEEPLALSAPENSSRTNVARKLSFALCSCAVILAATQAWLARYDMGPDGVSYLDIGERYYTRNWHDAINAFWSPLYSWLLGLTLILVRPSPRWEYPVVHLLNLIIFILSLFAFKYWLNGLIRRHWSKQIDINNSAVGAVFCLAYAVFMWSSLDLIGLGRVQPDMLVGCLVFVAAGLLVRLEPAASKSLSVLFGCTLAVGFLAKAAMFLLSAPFLLSLFLRLNGDRARWRRFGVALVSFVAVASPFVIALSVQKRTLTFGEAGRINYGWHAMGVVARHWQGQPLYAAARRGLEPFDVRGGFDRDARCGSPVHPTRQILAHPAIYEFAYPVVGTYPVWYDPSYWYDGLRISFLMRRQLFKVLDSGRDYYSILFPVRARSVLCEGHFTRLWSTLLLLVGVAMCLSNHRKRKKMGDFAAVAYLLVPVIAAGGMYALVHVEARYIAPFVVLGYITVFVAVVGEDMTASRRATLWVAVVTLCLILGVFAGVAVLQRKNSVTGRRDRYWEVAAEIERMGIRRNELIASVRPSNHANVLWGRLARVRIVAEVFPPSAKDYEFWRDTVESRKNVLDVFRRAGARAVVDDRVPDWAVAEGWRKIAGSEYGIVFLR